MSQEKLAFTVNSKVEQLLGRDLITNRYVAIFELIKNSYDAGATQVTIRLKGFDYFKDSKLKKSTLIAKKNSDSSIEIEDNGCGMNFTEIVNNWLQIGTTAKDNWKNNIKDTSNSDEKINLPFLDRVLNGEKGIGRLGTDKLGAILVMESVSKDDCNMLHQLTIDWDKYNDHSKTIELIEHDYIEVTNYSNLSSGLLLRTKNLREDWSIKDYENLIKNLRRLIPPSVISSGDFQIKAEIYSSADDVYPYESILIENDTFGYLNTYIEASVDVYGKVNYDIVYKGEKYQSGYYQIDFDNDEEKFGKSIFRAYYLDVNDKRTFRNQMGYSVVDYGNIRLYRDYFRVMPYGEPHNDWLEIDKTHAQGIFRSLGTRDLIGYVQISNKNEWGNGRLRDATSRLGLVEDTPAFNKLTEYFLVAILDVLKGFIFKRIEEESLSDANRIKIRTNQFQEQFDSDMINLSNAAKALDIPIKEKASFESLIISVNEKYRKPVIDIARISEAIDKRVKMLASMVSSEELLYKLFHEIKIRLHYIKADIVMKSREYSYIDWKPLQSNLIQMEEIISYAVKSVNPVLLKSESINLHPFLNLFIRDIKPRLSVENINIHIEYDAECNDIFICINRKALEIVLSNIIDNSIKALSREVDKHIKITTHFEPNNRVSVIISDTGAGVADDIRPILFSLGSSSTSRQGGMGIGLTFVKSLLEKAESSIILKDKPEKGYITSFQITFKGVKNG